METENENKSPFNLPTATRLLNGGADNDTSSELKGVASEGNQTYIDALNIRVNSKTTGTNQAATDIGGEVEYLTSFNIGNYKCIGSANVGSKVIEFWAPFNPTDGGIIRIDGVVMCRSAQFAITPDHPLELDVNASALGGEIYITDFNIKPMYFSIKDIIDNFLVTQKYFADFNINNYIISLDLPPDNIIFDQNPIVTVGNGGGLPTGQYSYSHRYVSDAGDRTNWSVPTPLIYVPYTLQGQTIDPFTSMKTLGNDPDPTIAGSYGVKMKFRINNINNYDYIEIRRTPYNGGEAIDYVPPSYIVKRIPLSQGQFEVYIYVDSVSNQSDELILATSDENDVLSSIKRAKAIRYFYNKVILGNIEYESRDVNNQVTFLTTANGNTMTPIMEGLGELGYKNPYSHAYKRMYLHGERYGFNIIFWDANFSRSLAVTIPGFANYQMPNKRDPMSQTLGGDPLVYTRVWSIQASTRGQVEETFEVVDYKLGEKRQQLPSIENYTQPGGKNILDAGNLQTKKNGWAANVVGYRPFYPQSPYEYQSTYKYTPVEGYALDGVEGPISQPISQANSWNPWCFNPVVNALGMCFIGISSWPSWATAFSIVRTKKAGRVVAQGLAFYQMEDAVIWNPSGPGGQKGTGKKSNNRVALHFPDFENGAVPTTIIDEFKYNPSSFKIQMVEPLGYNAEVFHFRSSILNNPSISFLSAGELHADTQVDMVVYANAQAELRNYPQLGTRRNVEDGSGTDAHLFGINPPNPPEDQSGFTAFGIWRNQSNGAPVFNSKSFVDNGNYLFNISQVSVDTRNEEGLSHFVAELTDENNNPINFYLEAGGNLDRGVFNSLREQNFAEPVYICNLVRDGASIPNLDIQTLLGTATYVKLRSVIGYSNGGAGQVFQLCGERFFDCGKSSSASPDKYVWVEMNGNGLFYRWINISYLSPADITTINDDILNGTTNYNGLLLYGTYQCDLTNVDVVRFTNASHIPPIGGRIEVRYDNTEPVYCFGGDTTVGLATFPVVHRTTNNSNGTGDQEGYGSMLKWNRMMPYLWWKLKRNYYIIRNSKPPLLPCIQADDNEIPIHGNDWVKISAIRQMLVLYMCQSYSHLPLSYRPHYPIVNYVMRPTEWDDGKSPSGQNIYKQYETDYPGEEQRWMLGGLRVNQFNPDIFSLDYSKENIKDTYQKVASILFNNNTWYPTRIAWSYTRPIQSILAPNLKSFAPFNIFDISDNRGQIQRLYHSKRDGENLYAGCEDDWCMVLTRKRTLTDLSGNTLGVTGNGQDTAFIQEQIWMSEIKKGGLKGPFYLAFAENGESAFYVNYNGVYEFKRGAYGSDIIDISNGYYNQLYRSLFSRVNRPDLILFQQTLNATYNKKEEEYWIQFKTDILEFELTQDPTVVAFFDTMYDIRTPNFLVRKSIPGASLRLDPLLQKLTECYYSFEDTTGEGINVTDNNGNLLFTALNGENYIITYNPTDLSNLWSYKKVDGELNEFRNQFTFAFSNRIDSQKWLGVFDYQYDSYTSFDNRIYGHREEAGNLVTYLLGEGYSINGSNMNIRIWTTINPLLKDAFLFERIRINSNIPPKVKFYAPNNMATAISEIIISDLKNYNAWENYIPRAILTNQRVKNQGTHVILQIQEQLLNNKFFANSLTIAYNKIR